MAYYVKRFENGYGIMKVYANEWEGTYGDIFEYRDDVERAHPNSNILEGFVVANTKDNKVPDMCGDWNDYIKEAISDYETNLLPVLEEDARKKLEYEKRMMEIKDMSFDDRTKEQQKELYNYFFTIDTDETINEFLGMSSEELERWKNSQLTIESYFRLPEEAIEYIQKNIINSDIPTHSLVGYKGFISDHKLSDILDRIDYVATYDKEHGVVTLYDMGDDLIAVLTENECLHQEDFAGIMIENEIPANKITFDMIWEKFVDLSRGGITLEEAANMACSDFYDKTYALAHKPEPKTPVIELVPSKIERCNSIIIKDPYYDRDVWCAFQSDDCSAFTHAKGLVANYDSKFDYENTSIDVNNTEFAYAIGVEKFLSGCVFEQNETGEVEVFTRFKEDSVKVDVTTIGCDTAQFSFGSEKTFGEFSIDTGADGQLGEVHFFKLAKSDRPIGLIFMGCCDGDIVSPERIHNSFVAAFGIEREMDKSLDSKIAISENKKESKTGPEENTKGLRRDIEK